jgi:hypothetical protein
MSSTSILARRPTPHATLGRTLCWSCTKPHTLTLLVMLLCIRYIHGARLLQHGFFSKTT